MATGVSGYFDLTGGNGAMARVYYTENYDVTMNQSTITIDLQIASSWYYGVTYYLDGSISVGGNVIVTFSSFGGSNNAYIPALNTYVTVGGSPWTSGAIDHNTDGSGAVTIDISFKGYTTSGGAGSGWSVAGSKTVTLTTIPRASTIGATDANIGAVSMVAVSKKSSGYTHSIQYQFGALNGYITESGGITSTEVKLSATSIAFVVPETFYAQIPNAKSGICTLVCKTYSGSTQIGSAQASSFTAVAAENVCRPIVSGSVVDVNEITKALTGDENVLIRYFSTARAEITTESKNSASIVAKSIGGVSTTEDSRDITNVETGSILFSATDSRGYVGSATATKSLVPYIRLTNNAVAARTDPTSGNAVLTLTGDCFGGSFGAEDNTISAYYTINTGDQVEVELTVDGNQYTASVNLAGLEYTKSHTIRVTVSDKLDAVEKKVTIMRGIPVFDWGENDFAFHVPLTVCGNPIVPPQIGYIYLSRDSTSPAELFGGTWERLEGVFLLAAGSDYAAGSTGGEAAHTLSVSELPSHYHEFAIAGGTSEYGTTRSTVALSGRSTTGYIDSSAVLPMGKGIAHNNMPPYLAVYMWTRVA